MADDVYTLVIPDVHTDPRRVILYAPDGTPLCRQIGYRVNIAPTRKEVTPVAKKKGKGGKKGC